MKIIVVLSLVAVSLAAPQAPTEPIPILRQESNINPDGSYRYFFDTANGISVEESGAPQNVGAENLAMKVEGQYQYQSDDGSTIQLRYTADENGFHPEGAHLPTPPPIPADIQRSLDFLATAPPQPQRR